MHGLGADEWAHDAARQTLFLLPKESKNGPGSVHSIEVALDPPLGGAPPNDFWGDFGGYLHVGSMVLLLLVAVALAWRPHSRLALGTPLAPAPAAPVRSTRPAAGGTQGEKSATSGGQRPARNPSRNAARSRARGSSRKQVSRAR